MYQSIVLSLRPKLKSYTTITISEVVHFYLHVSVLYSERPRLDLQDVLRCVDDMFADEHSMDIDRKIQHGWVSIERDKSRSTPALQFPSNEWEMVPAALKDSQDTVPSLPSRVHTTLRRLLELSKTRQQDHKLPLKSNRITMNRKPRPTPINRVLSSCMILLR